MEEVLLAVVALALGKKTDEVAELAKSDEGKKTLTDLYKSKVAELKTESFDNGAKDREKKVKKDVETALKDTFGVKSQKEGQDLFDEIKADALKPEKLTDEAVKASPLFIALEKKAETAKTDAEKEFDARLKEFETETNKKKTAEDFVSDAMSAFRGLKPILSKDETRKTNQEAIFAQAVRDGYEFEKLEDKSWLIKKDGKRLEDGAGNRVKFDDFVREKTLANFDIAEADERSSTGDQPGTGGGSGGSTGKKYQGAAPKTEAEFMKIQQDKSIPAVERLEIAKVYNAANGATSTL